MYMTASSDNRRGHIAVGFGEKTPLPTEMNEQLRGHGHGHVCAVVSPGRQMVANAGIMKWKWPAGRVRMRH